MAETYKVTQYGYNLQGKFGVTGVLHKLTKDESEQQRANAVKNSKTRSGVCAVAIELESDGSK